MKNSIKKLMAAIGAVSLCAVSMGSSLSAGAAEIDFKTAARAASVYLKTESSFYATGKTDDSETDDSSDDSSTASSLKDYRESKFKSTAEKIKISSDIKVAAFDINEHRPLPDISGISRKVPRDWCGTPH